MFPFIRVAAEMRRARKMPPLNDFMDEHVSHHICWPWDLDAFLELNNGRALTLFDIGRLGLAERVGLIKTLKENRWGLTMAGSSVRYRRRIHGMERFSVRTRGVCFDDKFLYIEQGMFKPDGECANHVLYRSAVTDRNGIVAPKRVMTAMGQPDVAPPMPDWIANWCAAEATRPWPPMGKALSQAA